MELKAPTVKAGMKETLGQIKSYAFAVQGGRSVLRECPRDGRFDKLVVNDMDEHASREVHQSERPQGLLLQADDPSTRIWVKKLWAQIIHDCRTRLKIFQQALNYSADKDASLSYLKTTYERVLRGDDISDTPEASEMTVDSEKSPKEPTAAS